MGPAGERHSDAPALPPLLGYTVIGPAAAVPSAFNCAVPVFGAGGAIDTYYRLDSETHPPLCFDFSDSTGTPIVVISARPSYLDPVALSQNMALLLTSLGFGSG